MDQPFHNLYGAGSMSEALENTGADRMEVGDPLADGIRAVLIALAPIEAGVDAWRADRADRADVTMRVLERGAAAQEALLILADVLKNETETVRRLVAALKDEETPSAASAPPPACHCPQDRAG